MIMRTTIELPEEQRARLREIAARRGVKGYSVLIQEAVSRYLDELERREELVEDAREAVGSLDEEEARDLEQSTRALRERWR